MAAVAGFVPLHCLRRAATTQSPKDPILYVYILYNIYNIYNIYYIYIFLGRSFGLPR